MLRNLTPDPAHVSVGGLPADPLSDALSLVREACALFERHGDAHKASLMRDTAAEIDAELAQRRQRMN